ncbi:MAG: hypothetical protein IPM54_10565 [Polyangiaceae bacterium]|nr:hypothetical protein [Polyangiaceae bacterium]
MTQVFPTRAKYQDAVMHGAKAFLVPELKAGVAERGPPLGMPKTWNGGFASVFRVNSGGKDYAVKCFTMDIGDAATQYAEVSAYLQQNKLSYFAHFAFHKQGIRVEGREYPIVQLEWVRGAPLKTFIENNLRDPHRLVALAEAWRRMLSDLRANHIAHGDLQHENVLVNDDSGGPTLRLIDYDTVVVPIS